MTQRERRIGVVLAVLGGAVVLWRVALPAFETTVLAVGRDNVKLREQLDDLEDKYNRVDKVRQVYRDFVERTGGTNADEVATALHSALNRLVNEARLKDARISPKKSSPDRKTGIHLVKFTVHGKGTLQSIVSFMEKCYELPYLGRFTQLKITPPSKRKRTRGGTVEISTTFEIMVLPRHRASLIRDESKLEQPTEYVKHRRDADYALIWERKPFTEYVPPKPPPVERPTVVKKGDDPPPPPPPSPIGDPQRNVKMIRMAMAYGIGEVLVANTRTEQTEYVAIGEQLDDGEVLLVHPLGAVTRREKGEVLVYPVGELLADSVTMGNAGRCCPELIFAYQAYEQEIRLREAAEKAAEEAAAAQPLTPVKDEGSPDKAPPVVAKGDPQPMTESGKGETGEPSDGEKTPEDKPKNESGGPEKEKDGDDTHD